LGVVSDVVDVVQDQVSAKPDPGGAWVRHRNAESFSVPVMYQQRLWQFA
jgi:hypothetical protein